MLNLELKEEEAHKAVNIIDNSEDWDELEKKILEENQLNLSEEILEKLNYKFLLNYYLGGCNAALNPLNDKTSPVFPGALIKKDNINYHIHGIKHNKDLKKVIPRNFKNLENVVCEPGISRKYNLHKAIAQTRSDECKFLSYFKYIKMIFDLTIPSLKHNLKELIPKKQQTLSEVKDFRKLFNFNGKKIKLEDAYLPERLEHSLIEAYLSSKFFKESLIRSLSQQEHLEKTAKNLELKEIHGIYGLLHEQPIIYFLNHPKKAAELKDKFKSNIFRKASLYGTNSLQFGLISYAAYTSFGGIFVLNDQFTQLLFAGVGTFFAAHGLKNIEEKVNWRLQNKTYRKKYLI